MLSIKSYIIIFLNFFASYTLIGQMQFKQLSKAEKLEDFYHLHNELKATYPYFEVNKRAHDVDWLSNKKDYKQAIEKTKNDIEFFEVLSGILNDLNNGHTDTYPTIIYSYFYDAYKQAVAMDSTYYSIYLNELEKTDASRCNYWKEINLELFFPEHKDSQNTNITETNTEAEIETLKNIETNFIDSLSTAIVHIKSFSYDYIEEDADTLSYFFKKAYPYKNLVIDIQGNNGGSTDYWSQNIIPYLINDTISYPLIYGFKNCDRLKTFKPDYFENTITYEEIGLHKMPHELENGDYLFRKESIAIAPTSDPKKYSGKIYLLVDGEVFSSSEALAYFCRATNFATIVGEKTSGDGVGTDPLLLTLPNSKIVIRFTGEMGLNPDGSANDETKTVPDLVMKASSKKERRIMLLNYIKQEN